MQSQLLHMFLPPDIYVYIYTYEYVWIYIHIVCIYIHIYVYIYNMYICMNMYDIYEYACILMKLHKYCEYAKCITDMWKSCNIYLKYLCLNNYQKASAKCSISLTVIKMRVWFLVVTACIFQVQEIYLINEFDWKEVFYSFFHSFHSLIIKNTLL